MQDPRILMAAYPPVKHGLEPHSVVLCRLTPENSAVDQYVVWTRVEPEDREPFFCDGDYYPLRNYDSEQAALFDALVSWRRRSAAYGVVALASVEEGTVARRLPILSTAARLA